MYTHCTQWLFSTLVHLRVHGCAVCTPVALCCRISLLSAITARERARPRWLWLRAEEFIPWPSVVIKSPNFALPITSSK